MTSAPGEKAPSIGTSTSSAPVDPTAAAEEKTRGTAQWLVGVFGTLGAALIGTLSLAGLGGLSSEGQRVALIGFGLAIAGVLLVLIPTAFVLAPFALTISDVATKDRFRRLRSWLDSRGDTVGPLGSVAALNTTYQAQRAAVWDEKSKRLEKLKDRTYQKTDDDYDLEVAERYLDTTKPLVAQALGYAHAEIVRRRFSKAMAALVIGVMLAATGAGVFASAETKKEAKAASASAVSSSPIAGVDGQPVPGYLTVDNDATDRYAAILGDECSLTDVPVEILAVNDAVEELLSLPTADCQAARIHLKDGDGVVVSARPVCSLPAREPAPEPVDVICR